MCACGSLPFSIMCQYRRKEAILIGESGTIRDAWFCGAAVNGLKLRLLRRLGVHNFWISLSSSSLLIAEWISDAPALRLLCHRVSLSKGPWRHAHMPDTCHAAVVCPISTATYLSSSDINKLQSFRRQWAMMSFQLEIFQMPNSSHERSACLEFSFVCTRCLHSSLDSSQLSRQNGVPMICHLACTIFWALLA